MQRLSNEIYQRYILASIVYHISYEKTPHNLAEIENSKWIPLYLILLVFYLDFEIYAEVIES